MGSGKTTVSELLRARKYTVLDADEVVRRLLAPGTETESAVISTFGAVVADPDGRLDRRRLGQIVFPDPTALARLEAILHPRVRDEVAREREDLRRQGPPAAFYDVPLLFEKNMQALFDAIVVVTAPDDVRRARIKTRTGLSDDEISARFARQVSQAEKARGATVVISNDGDLNELESRVDEALIHLQLPVRGA